MLTLQHVHALPSGQDLRRFWGGLKGIAQKACPDNKQQKGAGNTGLPFLLSARLSYRPEFAACQLQLKQCAAIQLLAFPSIVGCKKCLFAGSLNGTTASTHIYISFLSSPAKPQT